MHKRTDPGNAPAPRRLFWTRWAVVAGMGAILCAATALARQGGAAAAPPVPATGGGGGAAQLNIFELFEQSFDLFTVLLLAASLVAWSIIVITLIEVRERNILPPESEEAIRNFASRGQWGELRRFVEEDSAFVSKVMLAGLQSTGDGKESIHEAAELAASEQCARWFRKIEPLNVLGNMGPLLGLAGTVWGMVIAFAALGQSGGQASPATLSLGVSKALFHTLLGLLLAVPALLVFGFYRSRIDRICNRAMIASAAIVALIPSGPAARKAPASAPGAASTASAAPPSRPAQPPLPGSMTSLASDAARPS